MGKITPADIKFLRKVEAGDVYAYFTYSMRRGGTFGDNRRYAVAPVHTRFDAVEWFVWDAEHPLSNLSRAEVIRQADTLEEALRGL